MKRRKVRNSLKLIGVTPFEENDAYFEMWTAEEAIRGRSTFSMTTLLAKLARPGAAVHVGMVRRLHHEVPDPAVANELARQRLRTLQVDEAEAARKGGGQDELNAVENAERAAARAQFASEFAEERLHALQETGSEALRAGGGEEKVKPTVEMDFAQPKSSGGDQGDPRPLVRHHDVTNKNKRPENFPMHASVRRSS